MIQDVASTPTNNNPQILLDPSNNQPYNLIVKACVQEINSKPKRTSVQQLDRVIMTHFRKLHPMDKKQVILEEKIEADERYIVQKDRFVPSAQLIQQYQRMYKPSVNSVQAIVKESNPVASLFQKTFTSIDANKVNFDRGNTAVHNFVEQREEAVLGNLKEGKLEGTLHFMEESLRHFELQNLNNKQVKVENVMSLNEWKDKRQRLLKKIN